MGKNDKSMAVPRLRFPEFRGEEGWERSKLGSFATILKGKGVAKSDIDPCGAHPCIRYGELYTHYGEIVETVHSRTNVPVSDLFLSRKNDVIIPASGETKLDIATATCVLHDDVALGSDLNVLRTNHNGVFLSYLLNGSKRHEIARVAQGDTVAHLYPSQLQEIALSMPSQAEQRKIADCLASLDEVIAAQGRKVEALKAQKRGLMQQLFPREGETVPRLRFPEFRNAPEWKAYALSKFVTALDAGVSVNSGDRPASDTEVGILKTSCVTNGVFDASENKVVLEEDELERTKEPVRGNTIIISRMNTQALVGANAYVESDIANIFLPDRLWAAKSSSNGYMKFISYILSSEKGRASLSELATGTSGSMKNISKSAVFDLQVLAPELLEQYKIADHFSLFDVQLAAESQRLNALDTHKKGLMQQLFPSMEDARA